MERAVTISVVEPGDERMAVVGPYAALWILKRLTSADRRQGVLMAHGVGAHGLADQLERSFRQLQASAEWHRGAASRAALPSTAVTAVVGAGGGAGLVATDQMTTQEAAEMLGVRVRRVRQLVASEALCGRQVGRVWLLDRESVQDLIDARRTA